MTAIDRMFLIFSNKERYFSGLIVLAISLIIITPLCGFLFLCGCDWPWAGLDAKCNINYQHALHVCPWCTSMVAIVFPTGLAVLAGMWVSMRSKTQQNTQPLLALTVRSIIGLLVFFLVAVIGAAISAFWQGYPLGIGSFLV